MKKTYDKTTSSGSVKIAGLACRLKQALKEYFSVARVRLSLWILSSLDKGNQTSYYKADLAAEELHCGTIR
jgi:hypothetical protein